MYQPIAPCSPPRAKMPASRPSSARGIWPAARNPRNGTRKTTPIRRPRKRCAHSHQKMAWNASRLMPRLTCWYCGICWYLANASSQSACDSGGTMPMIGCHSVMERPEPVRRVAPPTLTIRNTSAATPSSHARNGPVPCRATAGRGAANVCECAMAAIRSASCIILHRVPESRPQRAKDSRCQSTPAGVTRPAGARAGAPGACCPTPACGRTAGEPRRRTPA